MSVFSHIFGQDRAIDWLKQSIEASRLPHAMIFAGPIGVGKGLTAHAIGKLLLCIKSSGMKVCGRCDSCRLMDAGTHPDFHRVYRQLIRLEKESSKARDLTIDVIRDFVLAPMSLRASMNHGKVFVIEEAESMNISAQNSLLKVLEEPTPSTWLILLTHRPEELLPTIRSRAQVVPFSPLPQDRIEKELRARNIAPSVATLASRISGDSLGLAIRWIEDGVIESAQEMLKHIRSISATRPGWDLAERFKSAGEQYAKAQLARDPLASESQASKEGLSILLRICADAFRQELRETQDDAALHALCHRIESLVGADDLIAAAVTPAQVFLNLAMELQEAGPE